MPTIPIPQRVTYSINEFAAITGLSRSRVFEELRLGRLRAFKSGRRTLIPASEVELWVKNLAPRMVG